MQRHFRSLIALLLCVSLLCGSMPMLIGAAEDGMQANAYYSDNYKATKITNPTTGSGEADSAASYDADAPAMPQGLSLSEEVWRDAGERYGYPLIVSRHPVLLEYLEDSVRKNGAAREAILAGAGTHADEHEEGSLENGGLDRVPDRSRNRLVQLEREADLAKKLAAWMRTGG